MGPEAKIQAAVVRYAREAHDMLVKKSEVGRYYVSAGWPDCAFYPGDGRVFFVEFKAPGAKLTPLQVHMRDALIELGYQYYVINDIQTGKATIDSEARFPGRYR